MVDATLTRWPSSRPRPATRPTCCSSPTPSPRHERGQRARRPARRGTRRRGLRPAAPERRGPGRREAPQPDGHRYPAELTYCSRSGPPACRGSSPTSATGSTRWPPRGSTPWSSCRSASWPTTWRSSSTSTWRRAEAAEEAGRRIRAGPPRPASTPGSSPWSAGSCSSGPRSSGRGGRAAGARHAGRLVGHLPAGLLRQRPSARATCALRLRLTSGSGTRHEHPPVRPEDPALLAELRHVAETVAGEAAALVRGTPPPRSASPTARPATPTSSRPRTTPPRSCSGAGCASCGPTTGSSGRRADGRPSGTGITWVVDPIDGTVNFLYGIPQYAVCVAAVDDDEASLAGAVLDVTRDQLYTPPAGREPPWTAYPWRCGPSRR